MRSSSRRRATPPLAASAAVGDDEHQGREPSPASPPVRRSCSTPERTSSSVIATITAVGTAGRDRHRLHPHGRRSRRHTRQRAVPSTGRHATDPTGDMTKVFGAGSPEWNEGTRLADRDPGHRRAREGADRLRRDRDPLRRGRRDLQRQHGCECTTDALPGRGRRLHAASRRLFGSEVRQPGDHAGSACVNDTRTGKPIVDPFDQCGFPGFDGMFAKNTLGVRRADAGGRRPGHVRLHLRRARLPRQRRQHPCRVRAWRGRLRPAAEGLRHGVRPVLHPPQERRDHEGQHALRRHRRGRRPLRRHRARRPVMRRRHRRRAPMPTAMSPR